MRTLAPTPEGSDCVVSLMEKAYFHPPLILLLGTKVFGICLLGVESCGKPGPEPRGGEGRQAGREKQSWGGPPPLRRPPGFRRGLLWEGPCLDAGGRSDLGCKCLQGKGGGKGLVLRGRSRPGVIGTTLRFNAWSHSRRGFSSSRPLRVSLRP